MGRNQLPEQAVPKDPAHLLIRTFDQIRPSGISSGFPKLFPSRGHLDYVLLARSPLYSSEDFHVRLACLIHAANVRSEPGSNPSLDEFIHFFLSRSRPARASRRPPTAIQLTDTDAATHLQPTESPDPKACTNCCSKCPSQRDFRVSSCSHACFRGHPECQRSAPEKHLAPVRKGGLSYRARRRLQDFPRLFFGQAEVKSSQ